MDYQNKNIRDKLKSKENICSDVKKDNDEKQIWHCGRKSYEF